MICRLGAHEGVGHCGNPARSPKPLALLDSSCHPSCFLAGCTLTLSEPQFPHFTTSYLVRLL